jgi:threonyl-tRNA synthetase
VEQKLFLPLNEGHWLWLPKGESVRQLLLAQWKRITCREKFNCISTADGESSLEDLHRECFLKTGVDKLAEIARIPQPIENTACEGLFETQSGFSDRLTQFCNEENFLQSCISSLHFILEMPRILGFEFQLILGLSSAKGARRKQVGEVLKAALEKSSLEYTTEKTYNVGSEAQIEVRLPDALGRLWKGPYISVSTQTDMLTLSCSLFGTMERFVALVLERSAGQLPLWLTPEQVRLIPLTEKAGRYTAQVQQSLESAGIRSTIDGRSNALGSRLYQAIAEKVPFAVIVGNREVEAEELVVKALGSHKDERMNSDALKERIEREIQSPL